MRGIRRAAAVLAVAISPSFSVAVAQGVGAHQSTTNAMAETGLSLDGIPMGRLLEFVQTQTAAGFEEKLSFLPEAMDTHFYTTWINPTLLGQRPLKTVRLTSIDRSGRVVGALDAIGVVPQKIELPGLDATSHDSLKVKITFSTPRLTQAQGPAPTTAPQALNRSLRLLASNFRLLIPGLETTQVSKIEAISIAPRGANLAMDPRKQPLSPPAGGPLPERKTPPVVVGTMSISSLVIYVSQAQAPHYQQWLATSPNQTRNGSIEYLTADLRKTWGTLSLQGLGITRITTEPAGAYGIRRVKVEMTIGGLQLLVTP